MKHSVKDSHLSLSEITAATLALIMYNLVIRKRVERALRDIHSRVIHASPTGGLIRLDG
jgi:hypothetical protein